MDIKVDKVQELDRAVVPHANRILGQEHASPAGRTGT